MHCDAARDGEEPAPSVDGVLKLQLSSGQMNVSIDGDEAVPTADCADAADSLVARKTTVVCLMAAEVTFTEGVVITVLAWVRATESFIISMEDVKVFDTL